MTVVQIQLSHKKMNSTVRLRKTPAVFLLLLSSAFTMHALDMADSHTLRPDSGSIFQLNPVTDGILLGTGLTLNITARIIENKLTTVSFADENGYDAASVNQFDRLLMRPYSKALDYTATILTCTTILTPALLLTTEKKEWLTIGTMYAES
ncbi:MAG: hypothetical protein WCR31_07385, partial [Treponema sp.]